MYLLPFELYLDTKQMHLSLPPCCQMHISTCVSSSAFASVAVGELNAVVGSSGVTGVRQTLVDITFTALAHIAGRAHTLVTSDAIHTLAVVEALGLVGQWVGGGVAVIQVNLTVDTCGTQRDCVRQHPHFLRSEKVLRFIFLEAYECDCDMQISTLCSSWAGAFVCID